MQPVKFMWLDIVPSDIAVFFENLTGGEAQECICVRRSLRHLVLFLLAVGTLGDWVPIHRPLRLNSDRYH